jgi:hypothetical protein
MASTSPQNNEFSHALRMFTESLSQEEKNDFRFSTFEELIDAIRTIEQRSEKKVLSTHRLQPFLESMRQYIIVIETFVNGSQIHGVIWVYLPDTQFENIVLHSLTYQ